MSSEAGIRVHARPLFRIIHAPAGPNGAIILRSSARVSRVRQSLDSAGVARSIMGRALCGSMRSSADTGAPHLVAVTRAGTPEAACSGSYT
jgi:hypothetical protein